MAYPPQPGQPQPGMPPQPGFAPPQQMQEHPSGTMILVFGILGIFTCPIFSIIAFFMGNSARKEIAAGRYSESGSVTAGWVLGLIFSILWIIGIVIYALIAVVFVGMMATVGATIGEGIEWTAGASEAETVSYALDGYFDDNGEYPETIEGLGVKTNDYWGTPYVYEVSDDKQSYTLTSYGFDGVAGGEYKNSDIVYKPDGMSTHDWTNDISWTDDETANYFDDSGDGDSDSGDGDSYDDYGDGDGASHNDPGDSDGGDGDSGDGDGG